MILDVLDNCDRYAALNPHFTTAFAFLKRQDLAKLPEGQHEVDGDAVYAVVAKGPGRAPEDARIETHDHYIDIQYVISGTDSMGWKARKSLGAPTDASDPRADVAFYEDAPTIWTAVTPGMFAIYFPEDGHLPMISDGELHKVIMKVAVR
ncbi:YhcH/YjgK/YiaL family protein [Pseudodesulfovibrio sediminis]|uniref:Beta-D-galactosidase n=1 Tax=Pseudodesulfovibrio sediminis TaxID=2810563 RepID=A0ABM7P1X9_9BACT|nr:YhcH/YjgK/YiaL family protein [Pseudodesulfovibrio sediminis]BCS86782.1 beta-D-galactosidase [Pseudodesulfovibrio sediminis]